jgi:hypothetical protein
MDWTDRLIYAVVGAIGISGVALFAMLFWLDAIQWPLLGAAAFVGGAAGALLGEGIWGLIRGIWDAS